MCDRGDTMFEKTTWDLKSVSDDCYKNFKVRPEANYVKNMYGGKELSAASNIIFRFVILS